MDPRPKRIGKCTGPYTPKSACTGTWIHLQRSTGTCTGPPRRKGERGSHRKSVQAHAQGLHTEKGRLRYVDPRPEEYRHVHTAYTPKRAGTGTWIHLQRRAGTFTESTRRKWPVQKRGSTCRSVLTSAEGLHTEKGRYRHVDPRSKVNRQVYRARGSTSRGVQAQAYGLHTEKGRYRHVGSRPEEYTQGLHRKGPVHARGSTSRGVQARAQDRYRHVDRRPEEYRHVHRSYTSKWAGTGTWIYDQRSTGTCTGPTH